MKMKNNFKNVMKNKGFWTHDKKENVHSFTDLDLFRRMNMSKADKKQTKFGLGLGSLALLIAI